MAGMKQIDVVVIGAGAAGMFCAIEAGRRGRSVLVLDHNKSPGEKIRISGGGRCNFTNLGCEPGAFLSQNPKFALSALNRYTQWDFIDRLAKNAISWHEKTLGQLFCDDSARQIVSMLTDDMQAAGVGLSLETAVQDVTRREDMFELTLQSGEKLMASSVVVATGGKSIPKMGASGFGYQLARQFGLAIEETRPALVPLTFGDQDLSLLKPLAGLSLDAAVSSAHARFQEGLLFTHRGLSGPSILQISSYWREGEEIIVDLLPKQDAAAHLINTKAAGGHQTPANILAGCIPKRLAQTVAGDETRPISQISQKDLERLGERINRWRLKPSGSEGYRTAEVTLGGVSTDDLDAKTMQARRVPGLFFVGEVIDVTGWLGGYNFQWAWSSGWAAGQVA